MRIGECADLSFDCLRSTGPDQWAIHVPLGKLKTERMVPVDSFVCRTRPSPPLLSLPRSAARGWTASWPARAPKQHSFGALRDYLHEVCHSLGLSTRIVPHQFRHTYATEMLRAGVSFPALMKLLGHTSPEMTMHYLEIALTDLQREFHLARSQPRHLAPQPKAHLVSLRSAGLDGVDRFFTRRSTCAGDVPPCPAERHLTQPPRPPLEPAHQNPLRSAQTPTRQKMGRDWPVKLSNRKPRQTADSNFQSERLICRNLARMSPSRTRVTQVGSNQEKPADDWFRPP